MKSHFVISGGIGLKPYKQKLFLSGFFFLLCIYVNAQPQIQWQNTIGGSSSDALWNIEQTFDGGYIAGGASVSDASGDKTENSVSPMNGEDYWIVKLDLFGNIIWDKTFGGDRVDLFHIVRQTSDGGYILGGESNSSASGDKTQDNYNASYDYWILKLDIFGNIEWDKTIGGNDIDRVLSIDQTSDGGYILGGSSFSNASGDKTEDRIGNPSNEGDYWVVKIDSLGNIQWDNTIGGDGADYLYSVKQTPDGGYILGGESGSASLIGIKSASIT